MKKLIINALLIIVIITVIIALVWTLSQLRAVNETEQMLQENTSEQLTEQKEIVQETQVIVNVGNTSKNTTNTSKTITKPATTDEDVNDFFNEI